MKKKKSTWSVPSKASLSKKKEETEILWDKECIYTYT